METIAIYPGRFQPMGRHHYDSYKWLENKFGADKTYIATSDKVEPPKSPLDFNEKRAIANKYGITDQIVKVKNPYKSEEITSKYDPNNTSVVFMVGEKDMLEDPRFKIGNKKDGSPSYFQKWEPGKKLKPYTEHGYLIVAPHTSYDIPGVGEMSGTTIRKTLSNPKSTPQQFKQIFGWYDSELESLLKKKFKKHIADVIEEMAIMRTIIRKLLTEGGAAGHMAHPFDIPSVKTGEDLIKVFEDSAEYLKTNDAPVKIDGINTSIRLADLDGKRQFTLDRGSNKPLDVKGITSDDLLDRFGEGHGMLKIGKNVLDIFNSSISSTKSELKKLGLIDNPNILFNIEYVEGQSNVQKYEKNFLVIHNLLEIKQVTPKRRETSEISYNVDDLEAYIKKLEPFANKAGFEILHKIPAKVKTTPNFSSELGKSYTVVLGGNKKETKSLEDWLSSAQNTKGERLKLKDGKTVDALSKQVFLAVKNGTPVNEIVADPSDAQLAIDSFVIYQATMVLGDAILKSMTSPIGDVNEQEGIVVRNPKVYDKPYKITGSFIVRGMQSSFQK